MHEYQIALTLIPQIGDITAKKLVAYCGGAEAVFHEKGALLAKIPGIGSNLSRCVLSGRNAALERAHEELKFINRYNIRVLFYLDADYPSRLRNCIDGPVVLYYKGTADLNRKKVISIVGTRKATDYGKENCRKIVEGLASLGVLVVSGLALGIDSAAHKAALACELDTIGVLGHGLDQIYPASNKPLAEKMISNGGLLTDFMSKTIPDRENFPKRNRIIAGMADAVVIVEAAETGGALITGDIANSYNRDVFAVPGRTTDLYSAGCNNYIRANKAALVTSPEDIIYILGWEQQPTKKKHFQQKLFVDLSADEQAIADLLRTSDEMAIDDICASAGMSTSRVASALLNLEFEGYVRSLPGKLYHLLI